MDKQTLYQIMLGNNKHPYFITERITSECLFANDECIRVYQGSRDMIGSNFYEYISMEENHLEEALPDWDNQDDYKLDSYHSRQTQRFMMRVADMRESNVIFHELNPINKIIVILTPYLMKDFMGNRLQAKRRGTWSE